MKSVQCSVFSVQRSTFALFIALGLVAAFAPRAATPDTERVEVQRPKLLVAEGLPPILLWSYDLDDPDDCAALILDTMRLVRRCHVDGDRISYEYLAAAAERGARKPRKWNH